MSIHKDRDQWRVKYRIAGRQHSRTFARKSDAITFDSDIKRRRALGPLLAAELDRETMTLDEFVRGPWRAHAATLSRASRTQYKWALEKHLAALLDEPLLSIDVARLSAHQSAMLGRGATPNTVRAVMMCLSGIMQIAVEHGALSANPVRALRKVKAEPREEVTPLSPVELERLIAGWRGRSRIIAILGGHLGLRPKEVRSVPWSAFDGKALVIGRAQTKRTAMRTRTIAVPNTTARELKEWRLASGRPGDDEPIIGPMSANAMRLWNRQSLRPAVTAATGGRITDATVYTLRHTHASALHYCGFTLPEAARRMGHGAELHLRTYAHIVDSCSGTRFDDLDALIAAARADLVFRQSSATAAEAD